MELFTSEGCSSCPPAESAAADVASDARRDGTPVYVLGFDVDYWNHGGWVDRFSDSAYSERQAQYAQAMRLANVYTPQAVVNGGVEFVGSDRAKLHRAVATALTRPATAVVVLTADVDATGHHIVVRYDVSGASAASVLNMAAVERGLQTAVSGGENGGRLLKHENVVRAFTVSQVTGADTAGKKTLDLPADSNWKNIDVICYVQELPTMSIVGAGRAGVRSQN